MTPISWMHAFVDVPGEDVAKAHAFWSAVLGWPLGDPWPGHPEFASFVPTDGAPYAHVQRIDGPPRITWTSSVSSNATPPRLEGLGATRGYRGAAWQVMASPPGCRSACARRRGRTSGRRRSPGRAATAAGWCSSRRRARRPVRPELEFWRAATGWADEDVDAPEFHRLVHRQESPLQLLCSGSGRTTGRSTPARTSTSARTTSTPRSSGSGRSVPQLLWSGNGFIALRDPLGLAFCVTGNDPER
jgi:hypothetical protein